MERKFLGWHQPLLHLAADYLVREYTKDGCLDLRTVTLVLPGRRAVYRLEEILAERAATLPNPAWYPPVFLTPDSLPEQFYEMGKPVADEVTQWFVWLAAVDRLEAEDKPLLQRLLPTMPDRFESRLAFARLLARLHYELAAEGVDFKKVAAKCGQLGVAGEIPRWHALARLQEFYANSDPDQPGFLDGLGLWDLQSARLFAIEQQTPEEFERIRKKLTDENKKFYLVGLVDMNRLQKGILKKFAPFLTSLIFAPENDAEIQTRFDEFGCLRADAWTDAPIEMDDAQINIVWQPEHQADAVLRKIASLGGEYASGEIIVGVQDKEVVPFVQQRLGQGEIPSRLVEGIPIRRTAVYRFLEVLQKFSTTRRFRDFAELIRHPDIEEALRETIGDEKLGDVLTLLDEYHLSFFPITASGVWMETKPDSARSFERLRDVWKHLTELGFPLSSEPIVSETLDYVLDGIETSLNRLYENGKDERSRTALDRIRRKMESLRSLPIRFDKSVSAQLTRFADDVALQKVGAAVIPEPDAEKLTYLYPFSFPDLLEILLSQLESEHIAPSEVADAIELIGWLDISLDDTPIVIVTGMNDGVIPSFANADIFLPDSLRRQLGVMDNRRRSARDAYALRVLLESRPQTDVHLIGGRRSVCGDPLLPSRFFFASENTETVARRVQEFFDEGHPEPRVRLKRSMQPGQTDGHTFAVPVLPQLAAPIKELSVTELKTYLQCPYRFYLGRLLKLRKINDAAEELPPNDFGNMIHFVLRCFGESDDRIKHSTDAATIRKFLHAQVDDYAAKLFGNSPRATIAIQFERAKARLSALAERQARWRDQGYVIQHVEFDPTSSHRVLLADVSLKGRIDRIDRNERTQEIVVLDYKTSSTEKTPQSEHCKGGKWVDFQLPLYHYILRETGLAGPKETIRLGYVNISRNVRSIKETLAEWSDEEIRAAIDRAKELVQELTAQDWPSVDPAVPPPKYDDFAFICQRCVKTW